MIYSNQLFLPCTKIKAVQPVGHLYRQQAVYALWEIVETIFWVPHRFTDQRVWGGDLSHQFMRDVMQGASLCCLQLLRDLVSSDRSSTHGQHGLQAGLGQVYGPAGHLPHGQLDSPQPHIISYHNFHVTPYGIISHRTFLCDPLWDYITPYISMWPPYGIISHRTFLCDPLWDYITPYISMWPPIGLYHTIHFYVTPYGIISHHTFLCDPLWDYIPPYISMWPPRGLYHTVYFYVTPYGISHRTFLCDPLWDYITLYISMWPPMGLYHTTFLCDPLWPHWTLAKWSAGQSTTPWYIRLDIFIWPPMAPLDTCHIISWTVYCCV